MKDSVGKPKRLCDKAGTNIFSTQAAVFIQEKKECYIPKIRTKYHGKGSVPWKERSAAPSGEEAEVGCQEGQGAERRQTVAYVSCHRLGQTTWNLLATPLSSPGVKSCLCASLQSTSVRKLLRQLLSLCLLLRRCWLWRHPTTKA